MIRDFFKRKAPLWALLLAVAAVFAAACQLYADFTFHRSERSTFLKNFEDCAATIALRLQVVCEDSTDQDKVVAALTSCRIESEDLKSLLRAEPRYVIFRKRVSLFSGVPKVHLAIPYLNSELEDILDEYLETGTLSAASLSTVQFLSESFSEFCSGEDSAESFQERLQALCSKLYPFGGYP